MSISVGSRQVISSGTVVVELDEEVTIKVDSLTFSFSFAEDEGTGRISYKPDSEKKSMRIIAYNFATTSGSVTTSPARVGRVKGKPLYIAFSARRFAKEHTGSGLLSYTFTTEV